MSIKTSKLTHSEILLRTGGISRNMIKHCMMNMWYLGEGYKQPEILSTHRLITSTGKLFSKKLKEGQLVNILDNSYCAFNVIYQDCTPEQCKNADQLLLSFRAAQEYLELDPIVLVRIYHTNIHTNSQERTGGY